MDLEARLQAALGTAYVITEELHGGGMSRVFVAEERALGRRVVIKVLHPRLRAAVNADRFRREIRMAAALQHPHIVPVLTAGELDGIPYYTMPLEDGRSLRDRVRDGGALPVAEATAILGDMAKALAYAHGQGVVHRDIKPDNVLLCGDAAVVTDFGIAKALADARCDVATDAHLTQDGVAMGTPAYMAPEQAAGDPAMDHRADLYAWGCVAYELFTGRPPFTFESPTRMLAAHLSERPAHVQGERPDAPAPVARLIMRCLEKSPNDRPATAGELVRTLDALGTMEQPGMGRARAPRDRLARVLVGYVLAFLPVAILAKATMITLALPAWVLPVAMGAMVLCLPAVLSRRE